MKIKTEFEIDEDTLTEFDVYCIKTQQDRDTVMCSILTDYIRRK